MATRRSHTKSRLGCHQCKKRRIKCDTKQPSCANCDKRSLECSFLLLAPTSRLSVVSTSPTSITASSPESATTPTSISSSSPHAISPNLHQSPHLQTQLALKQRPPNSPQPPAAEFFPDLVLPKVPIPRFIRFNDAWRNIRDPLSPYLQEVLDHYEYTTSLTLANDDPAKTAWQSFVPELASRHDFVVNCVLAVASLHLGRLHEDPEKKNAMAAVAAGQMNKALARFRTELANITQENAAALFASSTLTAVYFFRTSAVDFEALRASVPAGTIIPSPEVIDKMIHLVLRSVWALRGPLSVLLSGWNWVISGKMSSVAERQWWPKDRILATDRAVEEDARLCEIESLWTQPEQVLQHHLHHQTLSETLAYLRDSYALVSQLTLPERYRPVTAIPYSVDDTTVGTLRDRGAIFVWAAQISRDFIQLVEAKNREALVILAHWGVLPGRVRGVWWMEGLGANIVTAVAMALGPENSHLIEWPARSVGIDLSNPFGARKDALEGKPDELNMDVI